MKLKHFLLVGLVTLSAVSLLGCPISYTEEDLDVAFQEGYADGYNVGIAELESAEDLAEQLGYDRGYESGWENGERYGYSEGMQDAIKSIVDEWFLGIISVTSPVGPGSYATLYAITNPDAMCSITVYYMSGPSEAGGLEPCRADSEGWVSWTWKVGTRTTPGVWKIVVTSSDVDGWFPGETTVSKTIYFKVR